MSDSDRVKSLKSKVGKQNKKILSLKKKVGRKNTKASRERGELCFFGPYETLGEENQQKRGENLDKREVMAI